MSSRNINQPRNPVEQAHARRIVAEAGRELKRSLTDYWSFYPSRHLSPAGDWSFESVNERQLSFKIRSKDSYEGREIKPDLTLEIGGNAKDPKCKPPTVDNQRLPA
jgi:hypothetical protein